MAITKVQLSTKFFQWKDITNLIIDAVGDTDALNTVATNLAAAINEVEAAISGNTTNITQLQTDVGTVASLTTTATTVVPAINELDALQGNDALTTTATTLTAAINELDAALGSSGGDISQLQADLGDVGTLTTTATTAVTAINELDALQGNDALATTATTLTAAVNELHGEINTNTSNIGQLQTDVGTVASLTTTATTVVPAINELDALQGNDALATTATTLTAAINELHGEINTNTSNVTQLQTDVGTVASLTTTATTVVPAINELDALQGNDALATTATTLTAAVNELHGEINTNTGDITQLQTDVGTVASLTTTATTVVPAINELDSLQGNDALSTNATTLTAAVNELHSDTSSVTTGITAFATGGQANAVEVSSRVNIVATVATAGDSVKLPTGTNNIGRVITVVNEGASQADLFPASGEDLGAGTNVAVALTTGASNYKTFICTTATTWVDIT